MIVPYLSIETVFASYAAYRECLTTGGISATSSVVLPFASLIALGFLLPAPNWIINKLG